MADNRIDFRLLQQFGLSLNTKKPYKMVYDPCTWTLLGVYEQKPGETSSSLVPQKGIFNHLSVWDVLERLVKAIDEEAYMSLGDVIGDDDNRRKLPEVYQNQRDVRYQNDFTLSRIHPALHAYPEHIESICDFVKI